jgi:hypothetical protein
MTFPFKIIEAYFESISKNKRIGSDALRIGYGCATPSIFCGFLLGPNRE